MYVINIYSKLIFIRFYKMEKLFFDILIILKLKSGNSIILEFINFFFYLEN